MGSKGGNDSKIRKSGGSASAKRKIEARSVKGPSRGSTKEGVKKLRGLQTYRLVGLNVFDPKKRLERERKNSKSRMGGGWRARIRSGQGLKGGSEAKHIHRRGANIDKIPI